MTQRLTCGPIGGSIDTSRLGRALALMCADHGPGFDFPAIDTAGIGDFDVDAQVDLCRADGWTSVTVTHPWKTHASVWAGDAVVPGTAELGAANTLTFAPLAGHNTDHTGFLAAWGEVMRRPPGAVAGAGSVARAVVPALIAPGAGPVQVWDRHADAAQELAARTGVLAVDLADAGDVIGGAKGPANCTYMGMAPFAGAAFAAGLLGPRAGPSTRSTPPPTRPSCGRPRRRGWPACRVSTCSGSGPCAVSKPMAASLPTPRRPCRNSMPSGSRRPPWMC